MRRVVADNDARRAEIKVVYAHRSNICRPRRERIRIDGTEGARIWTGHGVLAHSLVQDQCPRRVIGSAQATLTRQTGHDPTQPLSTGAGFSGRSN